MQSFDSNDNLLTAVERAVGSYRVLSYAPGGEPIVAAKAGGEKVPAVLITAGAHSTEHAGVAAAVELLDAIETDRAVYVIPTRDPIGLNGYSYALGLSLGRIPPVETYDDVKALLREEGEVVHDDDSVLIALIDDHGYAVTPRDADETTLSQLKEYTVTRPEVLDPLRGRRVFTTPGHVDVDEAAGLERAYTLVVDPDGRPLHLNRFFTDAWAPPETRAARRLMDEVEPGLTIDNHETVMQGPRYHISLRPQGTEEGDHRECEVGLAVTSAIEASGVTLATDEDVLGDLAGNVVAHGDDGDDPFYRRAGRGAYWVDPNATTPPRRGEGLNATDYAAEEHGLALTLETGMHNSFDDRVAAAILSVQTAIEEAFREG